MSHPDVPDIFCCLFDYHHFESSSTGGNGIYSKYTVDEHMLKVRIFKECTQEYFEYPNFVEYFDFPNIPHKLFWIFNKYWSIFYTVYFENQHFPTLNWFATYIMALAQVSVLWVCAAFLIVYILHHTVFLFIWFLLCVFQHVSFKVTWLRTTVIT